ncbi:MAG TPA: zinc metallopeptidase [Chitinophagaceae bacterium]|nr:zinc metallopeptidase [Chitinophagaceae bacterium]
MPADILLISLVFMFAGIIAQFRLKGKFSEYGKIATSGGLSGKEVAEKLLHGNGIYDVSVVSVSGFLSDHYDPSKKTVNLGPDVYEGKNIAAAVAVHECGHALQHAAAYSMLTLRTALVPAVQITLPVEFDASARALKWLDQSRITAPGEQKKAKDALKWAALTYVVAALASIALLIQYILIYQGRSRN